MRWIGCLTLAALLALGGCATPSADKTEERTVYRLELPVDAELPSFERREAVLAIDQPEAPAALRSREMAYQPAPHQLRFYSRNHWADPPARMLEDALMNAFERAGLFRGVVRGAASSQAGYRLSTELLRLEQEFRENERSRVRLVMRVQLTDLRERHLLGSKVIRIRTPAPSEDAAGGVRAAHEALVRAMVETLQFTAETLPGE